VPDELEEVWSELQKELRSKSLQRHVETLRQSIEVSRNLDNSMTSQFVSIAPESVGQTQKIVARKNLVSALQTHSLTIASLESVFSKLSTSAKGLVQKVLDWIVQNLVQVLTNFSQYLGVDSWSVEATGGFPSGVSLSITITFK
jgi:hypothetical protein